MRPIIVQLSVETDAAVAWVVVLRADRRTRLDLQLPSEADRYPSPFFFFFLRRLFNNKGVEHPGIYRRLVSAKLQ